MKKIFGFFVVLYNCIKSIRYEVRQREQFRKAWKLVFKGMNDSQIEKYFSDVPLPLS